MAPESSSTGTDTSQSSTAAETTSQTSTTEAKSHIPVTAEGAQIMISIIAKEVPFVSDEQRRIIHEEIGGCVSCFSVSSCSLIVLYLAFFRWISLNTTISDTGTLIALARILLWHSVKG